jgi:serine/threonine protein kinase
MLSLLKIKTTKIKIKNNSGFVMPLFGNEDLHDLTCYTPMTRLSNGYRIEILYNILMEVAYVNSLGIVHVDVKLENFIVESKFPLKVRLIDFGLSEIIPESQPGCLRISKCKGTREYLAPEMLCNRVYHNTDMFSVGVIATLLWTDSPYYKNRPICLDYVNCLQYLQNNVPLDVYDFIKATMTVHTERVSPQELQNMSLFKNIRQP